MFRPDPFQIIQVLLFGSHNFSATKYVVFQKQLKGNVIFPIRKKFVSMKSLVFEF